MSGHTTAELRVGMARRAAVLRNLSLPLSCSDGTREAAGPLSSDPAYPQASAEHKMCRSKQVLWLSASCRSSLVQGGSGAALADGSWRVLVVVPGFHHPGTLQSSSLGCACGSALQNL